MLSQRAEEFRSQAMLQNYSDAFPDLSYPHLNMPPAGDYALVAPGHEQPWYNAYIHHGGLQNGGELFGRESKGPTEWPSYHSDQDSPYIPQQLNNNNADGQYPPMQPVSQMMGQQMQMEGPMMMSGHEQMPGTSQDPLMINEVHNDIITNGVDNTHVEATSAPAIKEEESLPRLDGPQATMVSSDGTSTEGSLKLPGFHQTFGNITEIGRFSQHDDYFESRPNEVEQPKVSEPEPTPKRKPRGRKRKQPETRELFHRQNYAPEPVPQQFVPQEPYQQWQYPRHQHYCQGEQYHHHWRPHPYYQNHHHHHQHYPQNMYHQQHYNEYMHYNYAPYQGNWPMNRDYMVHNYPGYV